jgi:hypothetical protein
MPGSHSKTENAYAATKDHFNSLLLEINYSMSHIVRVNGCNEGHITLNIYRISPRTEPIQG